MRLRTIGLIGILALGLLAGRFTAEAQQRVKVPLVGFLSNRGDRTPLKKGLHELGYVHGQNIAIVHLKAYGNRERYPELVAELLNLNVDVIVAKGTPAARAAKKGTTTIPIVGVMGSNPKMTGLVASLARPGGNLTGFTMFSIKLGGKRLELLKEAFPSVSRLGVLREADRPEWRYKQIVTAAEALGIEHHSFEIKSSYPDFNGAFETAMKRGVDAFVVMNSILTRHHRARILELVAKTKLPAMYERPGWVKHGGLMSYGPNASDSVRRAATYVDRILKGAKPGDLPIEGPTKFDLVINLKTAKKIGIAIPPSILYRSDKIIK